VLASLVNGEELKSLPKEDRRRAIERIGQGLRQVAGNGRTLSVHELRLQHAAVHLALPKLQAWETVRPIQSLPLENLLT
jgi:hypothetical protein